MNNEFVEIAYGLAGAWYSLWSMGSHKMGWFLPLFSCAICLFLADAKSRNLALWGGLGLLLNFIAVLALLFFPVKEEKKKRPKKITKERERAAKKIINPLRDGANFKVTMAQFADSQSVSIKDCIEHFIPHIDTTGNLANNKEGPSAGDESHLARDASLPDNFEGLVSSASFMVDKNDFDLANNITKLFIQEAIGENEYVKAIASIAYNDGNNQVSLAKQDSDGALTFANKSNRIAAKLVNQFFAVYCAGKREVSSLYGLHCDKLP